MAAFEIDDDVTFSANEFDEINKEETKKNLLNSAVLGFLRDFNLVFKYAKISDYWSSLVLLFHYLLS